MSILISARRVFGRASLTSWSLAALVAGISLGVLGHFSGGSAFGVLANVAKPIGNLWLAALQLIALPLVIAYLLAAIVGPRGSEMVGALGLRAVLLFVAMLIAAGLFTIFLAKPLVALYPVDPSALATLKTGTPIPESAGQAGSSIVEGIDRLLPSNLVEAFLKGEIFPLLLFTILFAMAVRQLPDEQRIPLAGAFQGLAHAMLVMTRWLLLTTPLGVFALTYLLALRSGGSVAGMLGGYVVIATVLMVLFAALLYPLSAIAGRTTLVAFARAVAPAQLVALSTRSSIAALPALVEGGREQMQLPTSATAFVLPLAVSLYKVNRPISSLVKLIFLAHMYGVTLSPATFATFLITTIIISIGIAGVPQSGPGLNGLPAFLAAGVPIEGVVLLGAVETIPDIFKTLLNVTGDMSVATILSRSSRVSQVLSSPLEEAQPRTEPVA